MSWDTTLPAGTEAISNGDDRIRELKVDIQTALRGNAADGTLAKFPGATPASPVFAYRGRKDTTVNRPAATDEGLFFDTTRNQLQRSNGTTYDDIGTMFPAGTVTVFYQASVPTGWAAVSVNDKFIRIVSNGGSGGSTGGSGSTPSSGASMAHSHTVNSHTHDLANHIHTLDSSTTSTPSATQTGIAGGGALTAASATHTHSLTGATVGVPSNNTSGGTAPGTDSQLGTLTFQYADVVFGTKN